MNSRNLLLVVALVFGVTETVDIPHTGIPAAVFAILFFASAGWIWRRGSIIATTILAVQFLFEVSTAHTWNVALPFEIFAMTVGTIGLVAVAGVLVERLRRWRNANPSPAVGQRNSVTSGGDNPLAGGGT